MENTTVKSQGIVLPTTPVKADMTNPKILILYSQPKTGKTTLLTKLPNCLIIDNEDGTKYLEALKVKVNSLREFHEVGQAIVTAGKPYKYVAIDTISKIEDWCENYATDMYKQTPIGKNFKNKSVLELPNGGGYLYLRQAFQMMMNFAYTLADNVILIGHLKEKSIDQNGKEVLAKDIDLTGKIRTITCANADAIGYLYRTKDKMMVTFISKDEVTCGSRCDHLKNAEFEFDWDKIYLK